MSQWAERRMRNCLRIEHPLLDLIEKGVEKHFLGS
jgi:hypothetical protein